MIKLQSAGAFQSHYRRFYRGWEEKFKVKLSRINKQKSATNYLKILKMIELKWGFKRKLLM